MNDLVNMKYVYTFFSILFIMSCEEQPVDLPSKIEPSGDKVVLVEEATGVQCGNCPSAAARLEEIVQEFPGRVIVVGIHGSDLTEPYPESRYDFRNEDAIALEDYLKPSFGKPAAAFNRRPQGTLMSISGEQNFQPRVEELLNERALVSIELEKEYDPETRLLSIDVGVIPLEDIEGDFFISAMITESHIIDYQLDDGKGGKDADYEHNHVLRDVISNTIGDPLTSSLTVGNTINKKWEYEVPTDDELWKEADLEIVVFVTDHADNGKEVLQAAASKLLD